MARFLLVHGACHGAWCWRDVLPPLLAAGHHAAAIDLPSHGQDRTPAKDVTLSHYARVILDAIDAEGGEPVMLVGHSMAGYPISLAAEIAPEQIAKLVYLCAYAPVSGMSLADMRRAGPRQPLRAAIRVSKDGMSFTFDPVLAQDRLYHDCPPEAVAFALASLCPQPIAPQETPLALGANYAGVAKHYIRCTQDRAIPPEYQAAMCADWPRDRVTELDASHSPFLSMPARLAERFIQIAELP